MAFLPRGHRVAAGDEWDAGRIDEAEPGRKDGRARAWLLVALGVLVFELTANPALGIAVTCVKFGWDDLATAFWLRRFDPRRPRGRACFWLYLAAGFWRICLTGGLATLAIIATAVLAIQVEGRQAQRWVLTQAGGGVLVFVAGFGLSTVTSLIGVLVAGWSRIKVWVGPEANQARRHHSWPPQPLLTRTGREKNRVDTIVLFSVAWILMIGLVVSMTLFLALLRDPQWQALAAAVLGLAMLATVGLPVVVGLTFNRWVHAHTLRDCWPEEPTGWPPNRPDAAAEENAGRWPEFG